MKRTTRHPAGNNTDILIIGGGASGLAAACVALKNGASVRVLEARDRLGRKLLATGNGRCNLMNLGQPVFFGQAGFAHEVLKNCPRDEVTRFFEGLGLTLTAEGDLCYPATLQAASVLEVLKGPLEQYPMADIRLGEEATAISRDAQGFTVATKSGERYTAQKVIAAAGGPAQPRLSGSDTLFAPLKALGHRVTPCRPALTAPMTDKRALQGLKGLRVPARVTLADGKGHAVSAAEGEVLFAQDALSGVCVMQLSRAAGDLLARGDKPTLYLDLSPLLGLMPRRYRRVPDGELTKPDQSVPRILSWLKERAAALRQAGLLTDDGDVERLLTGALPWQLIARLRGQTLAQCAQMMAAMAFPVTDLRGFDHAQVAAGGVNTDDVDARTMQSRLVPGLYLTGELLNVDGDCGGHNLLFAWATGMLAGQNAARGHMGQ